MPETPFLRGLASMAAQEAIDANEAAAHEEEMRLRSRAAAISGAPADTPDDLFAAAQEVPAERVVQIPDNGVPAMIRDPNAGMLEGIGAQVAADSARDNARVELAQRNRVLAAQALGLPADAVGHGAPGVTSGLAGSAGPMSAPSAPLRRGGGGPRVTTTTTTRAPLLSAQQRADMARFGQQSGAAGEELLDAQAGLTTSQAALQERLANLGSETGVDVAMADQEREDARQQQRDALRRQGEAVAQAAQEARNFREDPDRIFGEGGRHSANGIISGIAIALGQLGGQLSGAGGNAALSIINQRIGRDVAAQRARATSLRGDVTAQSGIYARLRQELGDDDAAAAATHASILEGAAHQAEILGQRSSSDQIRERADVLAAQLRQQAAQQQQQAILSAAPVATTETRSRTGGGRGGAAAATVNPADRRDLAHRMADISSAQEALTQVESNDPNTGSGVGGSIAAAALGNPLTALAVPDATARAISDADNLAGLILRMRSGTAATDAERANLMRTTGLGPGATEEQRRHGVARFRREIEARVAATRAGAAPETLADFDSRMAASSGAGGAPASLSSFRRSE